MALYTVIKQLVPGDNSAWVALSDPDIDSNTFNTLEEAQAKLTAVQTAETGSRQYSIHSY